jgi:hypothetical protein
MKISSCMCLIIQRDFEPICTLTKDESFLGCNITFRAFGGF